MLLIMFIAIILKNNGNVDPDIFAYYENKRIC